MKSGKAIVALVLALMLLAPALALAEADIARFEELVTANSYEARFDRHDNMRAISTFYSEDGTVRTETHLLDSGSYYDILSDNSSDYITPDRHIMIDPGYDDMVIEYLYDSEEAYYDNFYKNAEFLSLGELGEALLETTEADGVFTARTETTDPLAVLNVLARRAYIPEWFVYENGVTIVREFTFDTGTGDLLKTAASLVNSEGRAFVYAAAEYTYDVDAFDPAAGDSPFASYFTAPEGKMALTLRFVCDGTEMNYVIPHGIGIAVKHGGKFVPMYLDEACTQPYAGGDQTDELTLYVE